MSQISRTISEDWGRESWDEFLPWYRAEHLRIVKCRETRNPMPYSQAELCGLGRMHGLSALQSAATAYLKYIAQKSGIPSWGGLVESCAAHFKIAEMQAAKRETADAGMAERAAQAQMFRAAQIREAADEVRKLFGDQFTRTIGYDWLDAMELLDGKLRRECLAEGILTDVSGNLKRRWRALISSGEVEPCAFEFERWKPKTSLADFLAAPGMVVKCHFRGCNAPSETTLDGKRYCLAHGKLVGKQMLHQRFGNSGC